MCWGMRESAEKCVLLAQVKVKGNPSFLCLFLHQLVKGCGERGLLISILHYHPTATRYTVDGRSKQNDHWPRVHKSASVHHYNQVLRTGP